MPRRLTQGSLSTRLAWHVVLVTLDGEWHSEEEILTRIKPAIDPSYALRALFTNLKNARESARRKAIARGNSGQPRVGPEADVLDVSRTQEAIAWVGHRTMIDMSRTLRDNRPNRVMIIKLDKKEEDGKLHFRLRDEYRAYMMANPKIFGSLLTAIAFHLCLRGRFP